MASHQLRNFVALLLMIISQISVCVNSDDGGVAQWCIADEQTPDEILQRALDWACGAGGADCSKIQVNLPCYLPDTIKDHASYAFNSYWQKFKKQGATCYFDAAAMVTEANPSNPHQIPFFSPFFPCSSFDENFIEEKLFDASRSMEKPCSLWIHSLVAVVREAS